MTIIRVLRLYNLLNILFSRVPITVLVFSLMGSNWAPTYGQPSFYRDPKTVTLKDATLKLGDTLSPRVLIYLTTHFSPSHIDFLRKCWPRSIANSKLLQTSDIFVFSTGPTERGLLEDLFANNALYIHEEENPGYQEGAILALKVGGHNGWFDNYDWVVRLNPDVIIRNDTNILLNMMNPDIDAMFINCRYGGLVLQTDWLAFRPNALPIEKFTSNHWNAEHALSEDMQPIIQSERFIWLPFSQPAKNGECRVVGDVVVHDHEYINECNNDIGAQNDIKINTDEKELSFHIYPPYDTNVISPQLLAPPEEWLKMLEARLSRLDTIVDSNDERTLLARSQAAYYEVLQNYVTGLCFGKEEHTITSTAPFQKVPLNIGLRSQGLDWTYLGDTMTGLVRIDSLKNILHDVFQNEIAGDFIETGVWRGGMSIFARGVLRANNQMHRKSFVCDSFQGLPPGDKDLDPRDKTWHRINYLEVSEVVVAENFKAASLLDPNVIFVKGYFNNTMSEVAKMTESLAIMRLHGAMYESTVDVLYHLYEKLSIGGYVIVNDWNGFPSKTACEDFFEVHGISPVIVGVDALSVYWQKTEKVDIQYWRYEQLKFKD